METYDAALDHLQGRQEEPIMHHIRADHRASSLILEEHLASIGEDATASSIPWSGASDNDGQFSNVDFLLNGEDRLIEDYERALADNDLGEDVKTLIRSELLSPLKEHRRNLERLDEEI